MSGKNTKKQLTFNPFVILFLVIILVFIASFFVTPGSFEREVIDGRSFVVPGSFQYTERSPMSFFDLFRAVPNGLIGSSSIVFLVLIVGGAVEIYNKTGAIPAGITRLVGVAGKKGSIFMLMILFWIFAVLGGFLGWIEAVIPFVPLVIPLVLALGFDPLTAVAVVILGSMTGFALGPTNLFTVGIAHQVAELPMFSGFGFRFLAFLVFCVIAKLYLLRYAVRVKRDPSKSYIAHIDTSSLQMEYNDTAGKLSGRHIIALLVLAVTIIVNVYGMMELGWTINDMSALFLLSGLVAGFVGKMSPSTMVTTMMEGAKGIMGGAMIVGVARGVQWMLDTSGMMDPLIYNMSNFLEGMPPTASVFGILITVTLLNGLIASGSGKAVALMPIIIPLADLVGVSRQTATLAYQFGDGISNMAWFTYGTLLVFLSYGKVPLSKWYKFMLPLMGIFIVLSAIFLIIAVNIGY